MQLLADNELFTIAEKPAGVSVHPSPGDPGPDLVDLLNIEIQKKLGVVTRLDRQASGLVLLSADPEFIRNCKFTNKTYLALVFGLTDQSGEINFTLTKKQFGTKKKIQQAAQSRYYRKEFGKDFSLLAVEISTGRHHQIRKHLRAIGHPIIGDFRHGYNDRNLALQNAYGQTLPLCLHCHQLDFIFKNKPYTYSSPLPEAIQNLLAWLKTRQK